MREQLSGFHSSPDDGKGSRFMLMPMNWRCITWDKILWPQSWHTTYTQQFSVIEIQGNHDKYLIIQLPKEGGPTRYNPHSWSFETITCMLINGMITRLDSASYHHARTHKENECSEICSFNLKLLLSFPRIQFNKGTYLWWFCIMLCCLPIHTFY